jgi:hypothetical protein
LARNFVGATDRAAIAAAKFAANVFHLGKDCMRFSAEIGSWAHMSHGAW